MAEQRILILGGGVGGVVAADELRRRLKGEGAAQITVVDRNLQQSFAPSFLWVMLRAETTA